jgi:hypothetical protein
MYIHIEALGLARNGKKVMEKPLVFWEEIEKAISARDA